MSKILIRRSWMLLVLGSIMVTSAISADTEWGPYSACGSFGETDESESSFQACGSYEFNFPSSSAEATSFVLNDVDGGNDPTSSNPRTFGLDVEFGQTKIDRLAAGAGGGLGAETLHFGYFNLRRVVWRSRRDKTRVYAGFGAGYYHTDTTELGFNGKLGGQIPLNEKGSYGLLLELTCHEADSDLSFCNYRFGLRIHFRSRGE